MFDTATLDGLVKLANLGAAGVCVLLVALVGAMLWRTIDPKPTWAQLVSRFMWIGLSCAGICGCSGGVNAYFKYKEIATQRATIASLETESKALAAAKKDQQMALLEFKVFADKFKASGKDRELEPDVQAKFQGLAEKVQAITAH